MADQHALGRRALTHLATAALLVLALVGGLAAGKAEPSHQ